MMYLRKILVKHLIINADGDYSHATSTIVDYLSDNFYVNQIGIVLDSSISGYYDAITSAEAEWSGTW